MNLHSLIVYSKKSKPDKNGSKYFDLYQYSFGKRKEEKSDKPEIEITEEKEQPKQETKEEPVEINSEIPEEAVS